MDTSRLSVQLLATEIEYLRSQKYDNRIEQDRFPVLTPVVFIQLLPTGGQQHKHNHHDNNQLPAQSDHHDLERNHQDDRIQIIENSQYLNKHIVDSNHKPRQSSSSHCYKIILGITFPAGLVEHKFPAHINHYKTKTYIE